MHRNYDVDDDNLHGATVWVDMNFRTFFSQVEERYLWSRKCGIEILNSCGLVITNVSFKN